MDSSLTKKTGVVFLDLTAAYDAVWRLGLLQKLSKTLPRGIVDTVALFLTDVSACTLLTNAAPGDSKEMVFPKAQSYLLACLT